VTPAPSRPERDSRLLEELTAPEVAERLGLEPHREGGYFRETYRSPLQVETEAGARPLSTCILYLLTADDPSRLHRLQSEEIWFYHAGAPVELVLLPPSAAQASQASRAPVCLVIDSEDLQALVPARRWVGARVITGDQADWGAGRAPERRWTPDRRWSPELRWGLVSCLATPGFDYADFELGDRQALLRAFPLAREIVLALT
jgi:predicted cupin superfamily sugar epimerase